MILIYKNYISCAVLSIGLLIYCCYINAFEFIPATTTMILSLLLWIGTTTYFETFNKVLLSKVLCFAGFILSVSIFFIFGMEEVPFPQGALIFHDYGISVSLFVILISLLPLLFVSSSKTESLPTNSQSSSLLAVEDDTSLNNEDNNWEIATDDEIESGDYEVAA